MPRYYLHLTDGKQVLNNHKGNDLAGNAAARDDAVALALDLKHSSAMPGWKIGLSLAVACCLILSTAAPPAVAGSVSDALKAMGDALNKVARGGDGCGGPKAPCPPPPPPPKRQTSKTGKPSLPSGGSRR